jgi:hypothetical protein
MSRMVGGTFGVAVIGALVTAIGKSKLDQGLPHVPAATRSAIANALGSGAVPAHAGAHVAAVTREAFVSALGTGLTIGASVTLAGAFVALGLIQRTVSQPATGTATATAERPVTPAETQVEGQGDGAEAPGELTLI